VISLYEVSDIRPGESFLARDLIRGGEPVRVSERKAATTAKGRTKIVSWLKFLENRTAQQDSGNAMAEYDFTWLWDKLGVADLRK
jgi:hypothetical protein